MHSLLKKNASLFIKVLKLPSLENMIIFLKKEPMSADVVKLLYMFQPASFIQTVAGQVLIKKFLVPLNIPQILMACELKFCATPVVHILDMFLKVKI